MATTSTTTAKVLINYYIRKKWHQHIQLLCETFIEKKGNDLIILFWRAFGIMLEGSYSSAIREFESLKKKKEIEYSCIIALIYTHKLCKTIDQDEIIHLETLLVTIEEKANETSLLLAAMFYYHVHMPNEAKKIIESLCHYKNLPETPIQYQLTILKGWIDLTLDSKNKKDIELRSNSIQYFDMAKKLSTEDPELLLGMAKYNDMKKIYKKSIEYLDEIIVKFPWFEPVFSEKALILLKSGDWDQCVDVANRALTINKYDIEALRLLILFFLSREGNIIKAKEYITLLLEAMNIKEKSNHELYLEISKTNARISDKNKDILKANSVFINQAIQLRPTNSYYVSEKAYQLSLLQDYNGAMEKYKEALKLDESNEGALLGMIYCQIKLGQLQDASQQMEFLLVIHESIGSNGPDIVFLQALLAYYKDNDRKLQISLLQKSIQLHMDTLKEVVTQDISTYQLMSILSPTFIVEIAIEFLQHTTNETIHNDNGISSNAVLKGISILEKLITKSPGFLGAQMTLSNAKFILNDLETSQKIATTILQKDPTHSEALLLITRIHLRQDHYRAANSSLDEALSHDFSIRQQLIYFLVKAKVLASTVDLKESLKILQEGMKLSKDNKSKMKTINTNNISQSSFTILYDKASLYIQLAEVYSQLNNINEATDIVKEAMQIFRGTNEEVRILVTNSELAMKRKDYEAAIQILNNVPQDSPAFTKAQMLKADIYMQHRRNKKLYIKCYQDLVQLNPTASAYENLGDAYIRIQMLDEAVESFQKSFDLAPNDFSLASRIGKVLISKHDYLRAVDYYQNALRQAPERTSLRYALAELYTRLEKYDQALRIIQQYNMKNIKDVEDLNEKSQVVKMLLLLPKIYEGMDQNDKSLEAMLNAQSIQESLLQKMKSDDPDGFIEQKKILANICFLIAEIYANKNDGDIAVQYYNTALKSDETHENAIIALAKTFFSTGNFDECQQRCSTLLRLNPSHEEATTMLSDIMLHKQDNESAIYHFQIILEKKPDNFAALSRFILMLRRAGKLEESPKYLTNAEKSGTRAAYSAGLHYCRGLYYRYTNKIHEAIDEFNLARKDGEWGKEAIYQMVELYINPDNENLWEEGANNDENNNNTFNNKNTILNKDQIENARIAKTLLEELPSTDSPKIQVLTAYTILSEKSKISLEKSSQLFIDILENNRDYVPAILGLAISHVLSKQQPKARNQLKRIGKMEYNPQNADEFEKSYLFLADIYLSRGKYDMAQDLCKRALLHNKSCGKAWELLGLIFEKEQSYRDAAECYEEAWKFEGKASASIGFKLAFNYLKAKKNVEAIDVCTRVLDLYPDYPKIKKEILEKAQIALRP